MREEAGILFKVGGWWAGQPFGVEKASADVCRHHPLGPSVKAGDGERVPLPVKCLFSLKWLWEGSNFIQLSYYQSLLDRKGVQGFSCGSDGKESACNAKSACNAGDGDSIPGSGRSPGEGNGNGP